MSAKGYQYFRVDTFPEWRIGDTYETVHQASLIDTVDESPRSVITAVGLADHKGFEKYHVMHETHKKVRGRYQNKPITGYIAQEEFHIYRHLAKQIMFVDSSRSSSKELIDRLGKSSIDFCVIPVAIDLMRLSSDVKEQIRGGWFGHLKVADVSTIGLFGPTVGESAEWGRYEQVGRLKAIDLELDLGGRRLTAKIMSNRGVVLFASLTECEALDLLLEIQDVLDGYVVRE